MTTQAHTGTNLRGLRILAPLGIGLVTLFGLALATDGDIAHVLRGADLTWVALAALKASFCSGHCDGTLSCGPAGFPSGSARRSRPRWFGSSSTT